MHRVSASPESDPAGGLERPLLVFDRRDDIKTKIGTKLCLMKLQRFE